MFCFLGWGFWFLGYMKCNVMPNLKTWNLCSQVVPNKSLVSRTPEIANFHSFLEIQKIANFQHYSVLL